MAGDDQERLRRIRDQQIAARDPLRKQHQQDRSIATKYHQRTRSFSFEAMLDEMPARWVGFFTGMMIGGFCVLFLPLFIKVPWLDYATIGGTLGLMLLGFSVGRAVDMKDNVRDLI